MQENYTSAQSQPVKRARPISDAPNVVLNLRGVTEHDGWFVGGNNGKFD